MSVELLLDWAAAQLKEADTAFTTHGLSEQLRTEFQGALEKLEVLLALDRRFLRDAEGKWHLAQVDDSKEASSELFIEAQATRERALKALLDERKVTEVEAANVRGRLREVEESLARLDYEAAGQTVQTERRQGQYSLDYHLHGLPEKTCELAVQAHKSVLRLPGTNPTFNKHHIAYSTHQRFAMVVTRKRKVVILLRAGAGFVDPRGWTRNATGRRLGMERIFDLVDVEEIEYAMQLIEQSYRLVNERSG